MKCVRLQEKIAKSVCLIFAICMSRKKWFVLSAARCAAPETRVERGRAGVAALLGNAGIKSGSALSEGSENRPRDERCSGRRPAAPPGRRLRGAPARRGLRKPPLGNSPHQRLELFIN